MNPRHLHHIWTKLRALKPSYFLVLFLVSGLICILALRHNNQTMITLRGNVYQADKDNGNVQKSLLSLQAYVVTHMNTDLASGPNTVYPPLQLKYTYERLQQAAQQQANAAGSQVYTDAQHYCEGLNSSDFSGRNRVPCIEQYVQLHGAKVKPIPAALYEFNFISPRWSPDLAGWSLVISILSFVLFLAMLVLERWFKDRIR